MNQTQKRLQIINIAISITDMDTIQLQILKLNHIKSDENIQEILKSLDSRNYAKAQQLIEDYISKPMSEEIVQRVDCATSNDSDISSIGLYIEEEDEKSDKESIEINLEDMLKIHNSSEDMKTTNSVDSTSIDFDSLLSITKEDVIPEEVNLTPKIDLNEHFDRLDTISTATYDEPKDTTLDEYDVVDTQMRHYEAIPYIEQRFKDMLSQYPLTSIHPSGSSRVKEWLAKIESEGCSEEEIDDMITYIHLISDSKRAEAGELLLITASTQSIYAKFIFARELYRGNILEKNVDEAFSIIYELAIKENYPEAICDLAQFYEYGVGVKKDRKKAMKLYDEAIQFGIARAMRGYERVSKSKKSLFGLF
jgi:hypothetical protein